MGSDSEKALGVDRRPLRLCSRSLAKLSWATGLDPAEHCRLLAAFALPSISSTRSTAAATLHIDPVCRMTVSPSRARATVVRGDDTYYFCSMSCRDTFVLHGDRYLVGPSTRAPISRGR